MVGRAVIFIKMAMQLNLGGQNTLDRIISDYFSLPKPVVLTRDDDYLVLTMPSTSQLSRDASKLLGLQARLFQATFNSYDRGDFQDFPVDTTVKVGSYGQDSVLISQIRGFKPSLDKNLYRMVKICAGTASAGRSAFIAEMREKNAMLYFNKQMSLDIVRAMLKPFVLDEDLRGRYANYIAIQLSKIK